jgi:hypothetical protein
MPTKLREPKISVPSSQRRTSLIQDQLEKERENVQQSLCVNLISAQGEITQPDETEAKSPIQERLSHHLIDISGDSAEEANDEPPVEYKRELETAIEGIPAKGKFKNDISKEGIRNYICSKREYIYI